MDYFICDLNLSGIIYFKKKFLSSSNTRTKGIYYGGDLPLEDLRFQQIHLEYLRVSYWFLEVWHHRHLASPYWRFYWNEQEGGQLLLGQQVYELTPQVMTLVLPNTSFGTAIQNQQHNDGENILVGTPSHGEERQGLPHLFVHFLVHEPQLKAKNGIIQCPLSENDMTTLRRITLECSHGPKALSSGTSFNLQALILKCLSLSPKGTWAEQLHEGRIQKVLDWMEPRLQRKIKNADLAKLIDLSPNGFARHFKLCTGQSPQDYLMQKRLQRAGILLHHSRDSIDSIAERCGFCDRNYFSSHFKKMYGLGPSAYRKSGMK